MQEKKIFFYIVFIIFTWPDRVDLKVLFNHKFNQKLWFNPKNNPKIKLKQKID